MTELLLAGRHKKREPENSHIWSPWLREQDSNPWKIVAPARSTAFSRSPSSRYAASKVVFRPEGRLHGTRTFWQQETLDGQGSLGSATLPNVRTPYLHLRLPIIVRRVQRGEAKPVVNTAKLGEYLALAPEDIDRWASLLSGPLPDRTRPIRKRIDYVVLRTQYEQLLLEGHPPPKLISRATSGSAESG
jgi:hypothetical protein